MTISLPRFAFPSDSDYHHNFVFKDALGDAIDLDGSSGTRITIFLHPREASAHIIQVDLTLTGATGAGRWDYTHDTLEPGEHEYVVDTTLANGDPTHLGRGEFVVLDPVE